MPNLAASISGASLKGWPKDEWENLERSLIKLVYGSNSIESAGSSLAITAKLCEAVFRGLPVLIEIPERDESYKQHLEHLLSAGRPAHHGEVIRSRKEILQHAQALSYVIDRVVLNDEPWTEELILEAHRILHDGLDDGHDDDEVLSGKYRQDRVAVRYGDGKRHEWYVCNNQDRWQT